MKKFSLNALLHKDRVMIVFSIVVAVIVWAFISFGPANVQQRTITTTVKVDLTGTSAEYENLRIVGEDTFTVSITVEGTRSVIYGLDAEDLEIRPDISDIQDRGNSTVSLSISKGSQYADYQIVSFSPSVVTVECEKWTNNFYPVAFSDEDKMQLDVSPADESVQYLPKKAILLDTAVVKDGRVQIEGPQAVTEQIDKVRVELDRSYVLDKTTQLKARLVAYNESNQVIDLTGCSIVGSTDGTVTMTVPVRATKQVALTYTLANLPSGIRAEGLVKLYNLVDPNPITSLTLIGESDALAALGDTLDLGVIDFDYMNPANAEITRELLLPDGVEPVTGSNEILISLSIDSYRTKELRYTVDSIADLKVIGLQDGQVAMLYEDQTQILTGITLCGDSRTLSRIKVEDLVLTVDLTGASGYTLPEVRITVPAYPSVWVYYGEESEVLEQYPHLLSIDVVEAAAAAAE